MWAGKATVGPVNLGLWERLGPGGRRPILPLCISLIPAGNRWHPPKGKWGGVYDGAIYRGRGTRKVLETVSTRGEWVLPLGLKEQGDDGAGTRTQRGWHLESHPVGTVARQGEKQGMNSMTALSCLLLIP